MVRGLGRLGLPCPRGLVLIFLLGRSGRPDHGVLFRGRARACSVLLALATVLPPLVLLVPASRPIGWLSLVGAAIGWGSQFLPQAVQSCPALDLFLVEV